MTTTAAHNNFPVDHPRHSCSLCDAGIGHDSPAPTGPVCDGDHWMKTRDGRFLWALADECIVHGVNAERQS